ncbi:hypothetical protein [Aeromonas hydrophila]|uniref:hypothetical protein n=1 Tax=Aeromonas hydrophila TaxID=644 RepID=UPI002B490B71|nr:hypothetical protein [Aeromonas hydrophila]
MKSLCLFMALAVTTTQAFSQPDDAESRELYEATSYYMAAVGLDPYNKSDRQRITNDGERVTQNVVNGAGCVIKTNLYINDHLNELPAAQSVVFSFFSKVCFARLKREGKL